MGKYFRTYVCTHSQDNTGPGVVERCGYEDSESEVTREEWER